MSSKSIRLSPSNAPLPTVAPHLMPFHIDYTGPAPISTYFRVKPRAPHTTSFENDTSASLAQRVKARFTSAFRGRALQGLKVELPEGYSGVILASDDAEEWKTPSQKRAKKNAKQSVRKTRNSTRGKPIIMDVNEHDAMEDEVPVDDAEAVKTLRATGQFTSFTLWNPDVDVDEGGDEYLRTLSEYQRLLAELHHVDP